MEKESKKTFNRCHCGSIVTAAAIMTGLIVLGLIIAQGMGKIADRDRYVTVKGLAEREVLANKVVWAIPYYCVNNDIQKLYKELDSSTGKITTFLTTNGITESEIIPSTPTVTDRLAQSYTPENLTYRYQAHSTITVSTAQVEKVLELMKQLMSLMKQGVSIGSEYGYNNDATFEYTDLNSIKPEMIEEATRNARAVALKFAEDSDSELGKIKHANQGQFSITSDVTTPQIKKVRVVTTIDYALK